MEYKDLLDSHMKYGTTNKDIIETMNYSGILKNVVIAPWWSHDIFDGFNFKVEQVSDIIYNFYRDDLSFSFLELKRIGAPAVMDYILSLGVTDCKNLVFLGSAGSMDENIKIGDLVIPKYSVCGDGASRYLNKNLEDEFLKEEYPSKEFTQELINILKEENIEYHNVPNFSTDTVFAQFYHIDKIMDTSAKTIEMETALLFKCNDLLNINMTALFCISDNILMNKSLFSGRTEEERKHRKEVRYEIIPNVVLKLLKKF